MKKNWYKSGLVIITLHITVWLLFILVPYWFQSNLRPPAMPTPRNLPQMGPADPVPLLRINIILIISFYLNAYVFLPLLNRRKVLLFIAAHVISLTCIILIDYAFIRIRMGDDMFPIRAVVFRLSLSYIFMAAVSTSYRLILERIASRQLLKEKENEALKSELALLRSQVSPHFMFNVLNSMVALARKKEDLEPALIKLSSLMRYMIYSSKEDKVLLHKEIEYLKSYIDLQTLRFGQSVHLDIKVDSEASADCRIEPMLLIPFIENAFKHGTNYVNDPDIVIHLAVTASNRLHLHAENMYTDANPDNTDQSSGIGLENVRKRLELLYRNNYLLKTGARNNRFIVEMDLNLS